MVIHLESNNDLSNNDLTPSDFLGTNTSAILDNWLSVHGESLAQASDGTGTLSMMQTVDGSVALLSDESILAVGDGDADYSEITRKNTDYDEGILINDMMTDMSINMTGILVGDVDGSYIA